MTAKLVVEGTSIFLETGTERTNIGFPIQDLLNAAAEYAPFLVTMVNGQVNVFSKNAVYRWTEEVGWEDVKRF